MASNAAKSYIEAVMARADAATPGPWGREDTANAHCMITAGVDEDGAHRYVADVYDEEDVPFIAHARQDIPTLAKMLLRAIGGLEASSLAVRQGGPSEVPEIVTDALADINALAAKGSQ